MGTLSRDIRHAFHKLAQSPALSAVTVLALALGIGLTTMMFSIVYGALYRGLPFDDAHRLLHIERTNLAEGLNSLEVPIHDFEDWRAQQQSFEDLAAFYTGTVNLSGTERAERFDGAFISPSAFPMLGVAPVAGRVFREEEGRPGAEPVVLLGYGIWRDRYELDPEVVGSTLRINGRPTTVVGVMPESFRFPVQQDIWVPLTLDPLALPRGQGLSLEVFGRLRPGVSPDQANVDLNAIAGRLAAEYPETNAGIGATLKPYTEEYMGGEATLMVHTMLAAVFLVLLIACANVASLLLARAVQRTKELGVRTALGARRWRLVWQFLTEAFALSLVGAAIGLGIAWIGVRWFNGQIADTSPPFWIDIRLDAVALLFTLGVALLATLVSGGLPAWQAARTDVSEVLKDESRGTSGFRIGRLTRGLVVLEIALSCGLLVAASLTVQSVVRFHRVDYGFATEGVFTARIGLDESSYPDGPSRARFFDELEQRLNAVPGISSASVGVALPGHWGGWNVFAVEGRTYEADRDYPLAHRIPVGPRYFETFDARPIRGRGIEEGDRDGALPIVVVNESFARRYLEGDPLGTRIRTGRSDSEVPWMTVVGVVPDLYAGGPENENPEAMYVPVAQTDARFVSIAARTRGPAMAVTAQIADAIAGIDPDIPLYWVGTLADRIASNNWHYGLFTWIFSIFGVAALFLAAVGLYAVMAFSVGQRTREVGIRMALGAHARDVVGMILRQGLAQMSLGILLGLGLAALLAHVMADMFFSVDPTAPGPFVTGIAILLTAGMLASFLPARRATRVNPVESLRAE